jgi:prolyl-tRNA editing enzyme YbaK/EbsC (Cys-tRNA(Pro) deacylase)
MDKYEQKFNNYIKKNKINGEHLIFEKSCHTVKEAANAINGKVEDLVKNICLIDKNKNIITAIIKGENRVSTKKIAKELNINIPQIATPNQILEKTGYPCGGIPSFGYKALFLIDKKVMQKEYIYTSGGSTRSLFKIKTIDLKKANNAKIIRIRK